MRDQFDDQDIVLEHALAFRIYRVNQLLRAALYRAFRADGREMTPEQWIVLVRLWQADGQSQTELGEATLKDKATLSRILAVMERDGLVVRRADPTDGRGRRVFVTREAKRLKAASLERASALVAALEHGIPERDLATTRRTLMRLEANLRRLEQGEDS
jgi:MarR family transcriptional regulator, organic hydroperoxide resistance regulator